MNFQKLLMPVSESNVFSMENNFVWCGSTCKGKDGKYYLIFSMWPEVSGFEGWVTHSGIYRAVSDRPCGPFTYAGIIFSGAGSGWDADVTHNPTVIEDNGKYYLYYMGTKKGDGWWGFRNNQRIGVSVADDPRGVWTRFDKPVLDVTPESWDCIMVSNPTVTKGSDGKFYMMYKGVGAGTPPKHGAVNAGMAVADNPLGPFVKYEGNPIITNPENPWAVEDPFIWHDGTGFWGLIKDFQGYFTKSGQNQIGLFRSSDGLDWRISDYPLAVKREIVWCGGEVQEVDRLERPGIYLENGVAVKIDLACRPGKQGGSFIVSIPLKGVH